MGKSCCVDDCKNRFNKNSELSFYRLPKAKEKRSKWIAAIHRHNWNPGPETWICSSHFVSGKKSDDPLHPDYVPSLFSFTSTTDRVQALNKLERFLQLRELVSADLLSLNQIRDKPETMPQIKAEVETMPQIKGEAGTMPQIKAEVETMPQIEGEAGIMPQIEGEAGIMPQIEREAGTMLQIEGEAGTMLQIKGEAETMPEIKGEAGTMPEIKGEAGTMPEIKGEAGTMLQIKGEVETMLQIRGEAGTAHQIKLGVKTMPQIKEETEAVYQIKAEEETSPTLFQHTEVQTEERHGDIASLHEQVKSLNTECQSLRDKIHKLESELKRRTLDTSQFDDSKMKIFTGLPNLKTFMLLFSYVSSILPDTEKQSLKPTQELLLTLMKLRHNLSEKFLGQLFGIHQSTVSRIFRRWIQVMASRLPDSEFPLIKTAISQHVSPPGQTGATYSGGKVTPASVLYKT